MRVGGLVGGWIKWKYNQLSPQLGWARAWAELGKKATVENSGSRWESEEEESSE